MSGAPEDLDALVADPVLVAERAEAKAPPPAPPAVWGRLDDPASAAGGGDVDTRARALLEQMTEHEKVQLLTGAVSLRRGLRPMLRGDQHVWVAGEVARLGVPGLRYVDGAGGVDAPGATAFPVPDRAGGHLRPRAGGPGGRRARGRVPGPGSQPVRRGVRRPAAPPGGRPGSRDVRRGSPPGGRDGRGPHPGRPTPRHGVRQAPRGRVRRGRALPARRPHRRGRPARPLPAAVPPLRGGGRGRGHDRLPPPRRRALRPSPPPAHRVAQGRVGLRRLHRQRVRAGRALGPGHGRGPGRGDAVRLAVPQPGPAGALPPPGVGAGRGRRPAGRAAPGVVRRPDRPGGRARPLHPGGAGRGRPPGARPRGGRALPRPAAQRDRAHRAGGGPSRAAARRGRGGVDGGARDDGGRPADGGPGRGARRRRRTRPAGSRPA